VYMTDAFFSLFFFSSSSLFLSVLAYTFLPFSDGSSLAFFLRCFSPSGVFSFSLSLFSIFSGVHARSGGVKTAASSYTRQAGKKQASPHTPRYIFTPRQSSL
jgi:hypothetical protein